ncbi:MAG TPA: type II toxin-antitoxin system PemK/MazF family toxin [Sphingomonas sp.]|jgi:uncharacterized protein YifN (PemK superfamily)|uniref:type II toxin-antitoxin system PemK/MazF family toxin n=1 Tax=Sphingomonas sp. TaxID=28214 RepID=UPI002ED80FA8
MALLYHPNPGDILLCDYGTGFVAPEMVKRRPVVILSPRLRRRNGLVAVVPLSTTAPTVVEAYHCRIMLAQPLPAPFDAPEMWAKCDMIATVSLARLDRFREPRGPTGGQRRYSTGAVSPADLQRVRAAMLCGLGLAILTKWLGPTT